MGSGCSSPLRRLGGKRSKPARKDSSLFEFDGDNLQGADLASGHQHQPSQSQPQSTKGSHKHKFLLENEITIQSDVINEDHPSTASYCTDGKNHNEEPTKISEHSASLDPSRQFTDQSVQITGNSSSSAAAKIMGLNGSYTPHDRHLLVSPALSPAPSSTCYSPPPASSTIGCVPTVLDLNDLNEAFKTLTFGLPGQKLNKRIQQPERQQSELLHNHYTQHLVQTQNDLIKSISVIFITSDNFQCFNNSSNSEAGNNTKASADNLSTSSNYQASINSIETLANHIEANLKLFCDEHLFNLRFLNLSHRHLSEHFHISNLLDASMSIFEREYLNNSQRIIVIVLSNINDHNSGNGPIGMVSDSKAKEQPQQPLDRRQLPSKIEAQFMNKLLGTNTTRPEISNPGEAHELLKRWYNQIGNIFHLNPIYITYPKILSASKEERDGAWKCWLNESSSMIKYIDVMRDTDPELASGIKLKTLFGSHIEFIMKESALQKRTLLIRNYSQPASGGNLSNQQQPAYSMVGLNELARLLADPNKLSLKRSMNYDEFIRTLNDWIIENFSKFVEAILENQITLGKHVPPFIDRNLFIELTCQRFFLEHHLDNITESYEAKCASFYTNQLLPILNDVVCGTRNSNTQPSPDNSPSDQQFTSAPTSQLAANHLVFISGPKGCGKSTLFAQIIKMAVPELLNKVQIIYRFCGLTLDSLSPNRLLRSICEQFCQTQGENITAASYIYSNRREIMNALNKIIKLQASLIFLDALDCISQSTSELDLDWLCEIEANPRIKIFVMLDSESNLYKRVLCSYSDATHISLDNPSLSEWAQMLTSTARTKRFNSTSNFYDEIKELTSVAPTSPNIDGSSLNLTYLDIGNIIQMCRIRRLNNECIYPELSSSKLLENNSPIQNLKGVQLNIISHLQYLLSPYQICALFVAFDSSRNGLSESDLINIMTMISQSSKAVAANAELKFSSALLNYMMIQLEPWLITILCDKMVKITVQKGFTARVIEHYISTYPTIVSEIREILLDYFSSQPRSKSSKGNIRGDTSIGISSNNPEARDLLSSAETLWLATQASEYIHLMILTNPSKARDHILNRQQFFLQFLYGKMPEEFIEDYNRLRDFGGKKSSSSGTADDLQILVNYIRQSIHPLRYDGSQIYSQIYCRAYELIKTGKMSKSKKLNELLNVAICPPRKNLMPISETSVNSFIKTRIGQAPPVNSSSSASSLSAPLASATCQKVTKLGGPNSGSQQAPGLAQLKQRIFTIKDNHRHIIVIYPDKGCLSVWDIFEERAVRLIHNLDQPRDVRMIDQRKAVVLCNRELRVYDLDSGQMLTKLKGVMNQKMPYFEVFGDNYVIALARNRMYVNMLNLSTGELETTFKVGEDRFLNSLLVSANGGICVCGDETQKPFPLLVWNLNERRLLYDLRLDKHEFITRMSAISEDGHFVVSVCKQIGDIEPPAHISANSNNHTSNGHSPNFIVIYDLTSGTLFKKWKPGLDSCAVAISLSATRSGKVINTIVNNSILIWDLATGSKKHTLIGHSTPADVIRVQNNRLFSMDSTCRDQSLRIWDIELGYCLAIFSPDAPINCCQMSIRGDALVCGFAAETRLSTLVLCKNETVGDVVKRNKRRKSSKSLYIFDEPPSRKASS